MLTIWPPPAAIIRGAIVWHPMMTPFRLMSICLSWASNDTSRWRADDHDPGVVDQAVDPAVLGLDLVQEAGEGLLRGDVERQAEAAVRLGRLLRELGVEVTDGDLGSGSCECLGGGLADPARSAGDRYDLALE